MSFSPIIFLIIGSYLSGSLPFSLWISRARGIDLLSVGSGNLGATNVYRQLGLRFAGLVFFMDALKTAIPTLISMTVLDNPWMHIGIGFTCIIGHSLSIFTRFKGGKGAAPGLGVIAVLCPPVFGIVAINAIIIIALFRIVSVATIFNCIGVPILFWFFEQPKEYITIVTICCVFIIFRHKSNISRLIRGCEHKV